MLNEMQITEVWNEFKSGVRNIWGQVSDKELEMTNGNLSKISGLLQNKFGESRESVQSKLETLMQSFENDTDLYQKGVGDTSYQRSPLTDSTDSSQL